MEEHQQKASKTIAQVLECSICYEQMTKPKVLPCQHTFCLDCLTKRADITAKKISCAICRSLHDLPSICIEHEFGLPNNLTLMAIIDSMTPPSPPSEKTIIKPQKACYKYPQWYNGYKCNPDPGPIPLRYTIPVTNNAHTMPNLLSNVSTYCNVQGINFGINIGNTSFPIKFTSMNIDILIDKSNLKKKCIERL